MLSAVDSGEKPTPGLNFDVTRVELFTPPDPALRDQEMARNSQFYTLMHDKSAGKSKIDEILEGVRSGYAFNLPKITTGDKPPTIEQANSFKFDLETIDEIEKNKKKVVRFYDGGDEVKDGYYGERNRGIIGSNSGGGKELFGVKSSYIVRTTLLFYSNLAIIEESNRPKIYCTGFCYPQFTEGYCKALSDDQLKDLLKSAFKLQIYATLEARNQQIEENEISKETQVPLILNKPHEFIRKMSSVEVDKIRDQTKSALKELFQEQEITRAIEGKIDRVFLFDKPKQDERDYNPSEQDEANKAFFTCEESDFAGLKVHRMPNKDIIDLAKKYNNQNGVRIAVPIMKHPTNKDGNGMEGGSRAMEETFAMCSCYVWPKYLDGRGGKLNPATPINFQKFHSSKIAEEVASEGPKPISFKLSLPRLTTKNDFLPGLIIGGSVGFGLCATALACGVVLTAPVAAIGVGVVGATALTGALLYPQAKPFVENIMKKDRHSK
jgi:hypothetical protein